MIPFLALFGCPAPELPTTVVIDGPAEVRLEQFGPIDLPPVAVMKGEVPVENPTIVWSVVPAELASIDAGHLEVRTAGQGTVTAMVDGVQASFALTVAPPVTVSFVDPPEWLAVGSSVQLVTGTRIGDKVAMVESAPTFQSSNDAFAIVSATGTVTAVSPGLVYITAHLGKAEAMVEIEVR